MAYGERICVVQKKHEGVTVEVGFPRRMECRIRSTQRRAPGDLWRKPWEIKDGGENGL